MTTKSRVTLRSILIFSLVPLAIAIAISAGHSLLIPIVHIASAPSAPTSPKPKKTTPLKQPTPSEPVTLHGKTISVGGSFNITVPNGWKASVSTNPTFLAIQFGRPNTIHTLGYNKATKPQVDYNGIPSWGGLTEHFYIRDVSAAGQLFNPGDHAEVSSAELFLFNDGTKGTKHSVTKRVSEAQKWGGLQKDDKWHGRVYTYKKGNKIIEAHLAFYPSTDIDLDFFEKVVKTISL